LPHWPGGIGLGVGGTGVDGAGVALGALVEVGAVVAVGGGPGWVRVALGARVAVGGRGVKGAAVVETGKPPVAVSLGTGVPGVAGVEVGGDEGTLLSVRVGEGVVEGSSGS